MQIVEETPITPGIEPPIPSCGLPLVGLERNEPIRRALNQAGTRLVVPRLDPGLIIHSGGRRFARPASVEAWIETTQEVWNEDGSRDFWENVWNVAITAWDFIDAFHREPWSPPSVAFPWFSPAFWKAGQRAMDLFAPTHSILSRHLGSSASPMARWILDTLRFQYGCAPLELPFGMAAIALNAPSESYFLAPSRLPVPTLDAEDSATGWRIQLAGSAKPEARDCLAHQIVVDPIPAGLASPSVVWIAGESGASTLYVRVEAAIEQPDQVVGKLLGYLNSLPTAAWNPLAVNAISRARTIASPDGIERIESDWPWTGPVRALVASPSFRSLRIQPSRGFGFETAPVRSEFKL